MLIHYIRYATDLPSEDGIYPDEVDFFVSLSEAEKNCQERNEVHLQQWQERYQTAKEKWEKMEAAWTALEKAGLNAKSALVYHERIYTFTEYEPVFVVASIEVKEEDN